MFLNDRIAQVVKRANAFYQAQSPGHFLVNTKIPVAAPPVPPLYEFDLDAQLDIWLDHQLAAKRPGWVVKAGLDDDSLPCICPAFGIAEHSAWLGMDVQLQADTCLPIPIINNLEDLQNLKLDSQNNWFRYMQAGYHYLHSRKDGTFVTCVRGAMTPMDLANALRGDEIFVDFLTRPDFCHALLDFLTGAIQWWFSHILTWADNIRGGHAFVFGGSWMPAGTFGHVSNDAAMLCSPAIYEEFGYPYEHRLFSQYKRVLYHVHNEKMHYVSKLAELPGLALLEVTHDPKTTPPIEDLDRILPLTGTAGLMLLNTTSDQVRTNIHTLKNRNVFIEVSCTDRQDAADIIAFVRSHSKPLE